MLFRVTQTHGNSIHEFLSSYQVILAFCKHTKKYKFLHTFSIQKYIQKNFCCSTESGKQTCYNTKSAIQKLHYKLVAIQNLQYKFLHIESAYKFLVQKNFCIQIPAYKICIQKYRNCIQISTAKKFLHTKIQKLHTNFCCKKISAYRICIQISSALGFLYT